MSKPARIAVGGFQHETNTFSPVPGAFEAFEAADGWPGLTIGHAVFDTLQGYNIGMAGLLEGAAAEGWEVAPLAWCGGGASGLVTEDAFERISALLLDQLRQATPVDGVLLDLHGAMVAAHCDDGDAEFLRRVRAEVGPETPIVCSLDLHANISTETASLADQLVVYRTYPHLDMAETGRRAARFLASLLTNGKAGQLAFRKLPFLIPTTRGCTLVDPAKAVYAHMAELETRPGVSSLSFACGFSPADVAHAGPAIVGYGEDRAAVTDAVEDLYDFALSLEAAFAESLWRVDDAVAHAQQAATTASGPVILADVDDNAGAGEPSDGTWLLEALLRQGVHNAALGVMCDPEAVIAAHQAGLGATVTLGLGGKSGRSGAPPIHGEYQVEALSDGRFLAKGSYFANSWIDLGSMALLRRHGVSIVTSTRREQAADREMFRHLGVEPEQTPIMVLKSTVHYRADFQPIAAEILEVGAPYRSERGPPPYRKLRPGLRVEPCGVAIAWTK